LVAGWGRGEWRVWAHPTPLLVFFTSIHDFPGGGVAPGLHTERLLSPCQQLSCRRNQSKRWSWAGAAAWWTMDERGCDLHARPVHEHVPGAGPTCSAASVVSLETKVSLPSIFLHLCFLSQIDFLKHIFVRSQGVNRSSRFPEAYICAWSVASNKGIGELRRDPKIPWPLFS
jgi:hypothetical protein